MDTASISHQLCCNRGTAAQVQAAVDKHWERCTVPGAVRGAGRQLPVVPAVPRGRRGGYRTVKEEAAESAGELTGSSGDAAAAAAARHERGGAWSRAASLAPSASPINAALK